MVATEALKVNVGYCVSRLQKSRFGWIIVFSVNVASSWMILYSALLSNIESYNSVKVNGIINVFSTNWRMVRLREIRVRNKSINGDYVIYYVQKKSVQLFIYLIGRSKVKLLSVMFIKRFIQSLIFSISVLSRNEVSFINNTNRINFSVSAILSFDNTRMFLSISEVIEIVAIIIDKAISVVFVVIESGILNSTFKLQLSCIISISSVVVISKIVSIIVVIFIE